MDRTRRLLVLTALALLAFPASGAPASPQDEARVAAALAFAATLQREDGTWPLYTQGYAAEAASAAGLDPKAWPRSDRSAFEAQGPEKCEHFDLATEREDCVYKSLLRAVHAVGTSGYDPTLLRGERAVEAVRAGFVGGQFGQPVYVNDDIWAILALRAAGIPASDPQIQAAAANVRRAQVSDGGWSHTAVATRSGVELTGMALAALAAAGEDVSSNAQARAFIERSYDAESGGFRDPAPAAVNCQTTVWGIHAAALLGLDFGSAPLDHLRKLQRPDGRIVTSAGAAPSDASDLWCTLEAVVVLSGARYPLPSHAPASVTTTDLVAGRPASLSIAGPFQRATWIVGGARLDGTNVLWTPPAHGPNAYTLLAEGSGTRHRASGTFAVASPPPVLALGSLEFETLRRTPVAIDASASSDPDGSVVALHVDWGDGNVTTQAALVAEHAYALPGNFTARARVVDDAGASSAWERVAVRVRNRAPVLAGLPAEIVADRALPVTFAPRATDADGDDVAIEGPTRVAFTRLGNASISFRATDPFGGVALHDVRVEVVNLPPRLANLTLPATLRAGEAAAFSIEAWDDDGPAPTVSWRLGNASWNGASMTTTLPSGTHDLAIEVRDADGAIREEHLRLVVADAEESPPPEEPTIVPLDADEPPAGPAAAPAPLGPLALDMPSVVRTGAVASIFVLPLEEGVLYRFDLGDGNATAWSPSSSVAHRYAIPGAYAIVVEARADDGRLARVESVLRVEAPPARTPIPAEPVVPLDASAPLDPGADVTPAEDPGVQRETPVPTAMPLAALLLAALGRRGRRA